MAVREILKDCVITVNNIDLSDHFSSVTLEDTADQIEFTSFSAAGYREYAQGLKTASITATAFIDYSGTSVDAVLRPFYQSGGTVEVTVKPHQGAPSATNPIYRMTARMYNYRPLGGNVGEASTTDVTFANAGTAGLTYGTV